MKKLAMNRKFAAAVLTLAAFATAGIISVWRLLEESPSLFVVIPAICFPLAAALWLVFLLRQDDQASTSD